MPKSLNARFIVLFLFVLACYGAQSVMGQSSDIESALKSDDVEWVKQHSDVLPDSLFHQSVLAGAERVAEYALSQGGDIHSVDKDGQTALLNAVNASDAAMVTLLLERGANPDQKEEAGLLGTPLMYATSSVSTGIARLLLNGGANVNLVDMNGDAALNWASFYGHVAHMNLLVSHGANLKLTSKHGDAVDVVLRLWHADSVATVFRHTELAEPISQPASRGFEALRNRDLNALEQLLSEGLDPDTVDELGVPLLQLATELGYVDAAAALFEHGANPNQLNRVGQSALAIGSRFGQTSMIHFLLAQGADPNGTGAEYGLTPLMGAAVNGDVALGHLLIGAGANMDLIDVVNTSSALHWSIFYGNENFASFLIEAGADYKMKIFEGTEDALSLSTAYGLTTVRDLIIKKNKEENPLLGSWKVDQINWILADTTYVLDHVEFGRLLVSPSTYSIMYSPSDEPRTPFKSLSEPTSEEMVAAFQSMVFNSGTYELTDDLFTTTADLARVPGFEGGTQYYEYVVDGDELNFTMVDETYPDGSKPSWYSKMKVHFLLHRE